MKSRYSQKWFWFIPFVWTTVEYIRNMDLQTGGPWTALANTQLDFLTLVQNAEVTGIYGITFWLILLNVSIFNWLDSPFSRNTFAVIAIFIMPWLTGLQLTPFQTSGNANNIDISVIQPNIHLSQKWKPGGARVNIESLLTLSEPAIKRNTDLIIWHSILHRN